MDAVIGNSFLGIAVDELKDLVLVGKLSGDDLLEVTRELELLDQYYPQEGITYVNQSMEMGFDFLKAESVQAYFKGFGIEDRKLSTRRFAFSERIMMVDAFETHLSLMRRLRQAVEKPWNEAWEIQKSVWRELESSRNPILQEVWSLPGRPEIPRNSFRERRAHLRLLRMATTYLATGKITELDDPFGAKVASLSVGDRVKFWSVGPDGVDDGGAGEWKPDKGKDIVIEIPRRRQTVDTPSSASDEWDKIQISVRRVTRDSYGIIVAASSKDQVLKSPEFIQSGDSWKLYSSELNGALILGPSNRTADGLHLRIEGSWGSGRDISPVSLDAEIWILRMERMTANWMTRGSIDLGGTWTIQRSTIQSSEEPSRREQAILIYKKFPPKDWGIERLIMIAKRRHGGPITPDEQQFIQNYELWLLGEHISREGK